MGRTLFPVGDFPSKASGSKVKPIPISRWEELEGLRDGDLIAPLNDYLMEWDSNCVRPSTLESWRWEGDDLCDQVVEILKIQPGKDGLQLVLDHMALPAEQRDPCIEEFWHQISRLPPDPISALPPRSSPQTAYATSADISDDARPTQALRKPDRHPHPTVSQGQAVFWRYSAQIFDALMHFSLATGFSAVRVVNVLRETNYLTGEAREHTYKRLLETTQAVLDYMNDLTPVTGIGWKSAVRVRILHASVRVRIRASEGMKKVYDEKVDGIPINQEDLIATLGSFAIAPLWSLKRVGVRLTPEEEAAYVAVWRHIGYYLGISPKRLERFYSGHDSVSKASKLFACITMHLYPSTDLTEDYRASSAYRLLSAVADRPPFRTPVEYHVAVSRHLSGKGLADRLRLPKTNIRTMCRMKRRFFLNWLLVSFGRVWRTGWEKDRVSLTRTLVSMIVCWQLGSKRTKFTIKTFVDGVAPVEVTPGDDRSEIDGKVTELEKAQRKDEDEDELDPEVQMGPEAGKAIVKRWQWLLIEMGVVYVGTVCTAVFGVWQLSRWL